MAVEGQPSGYIVEWRAHHENGGLDMLEHFALDRSGVVVDFRSIRGTPETIDKVIMFLDQNRAVPRISAMQIEITTNEQPLIYH